jgi:hypothetical protein
MRLMLESGNGASVQWSSHGKAMLRNNKFPDSDRLDSNMYIPVNQATCTVRCVAGAVTIAVALLMPLDGHCKAVAENGRSQRQ